MHAKNGASELLALFDVALTADRMFQKCIFGLAFPNGDSSMIGDISKGFFVNVEGCPEKAAISANSISMEFVAYNRRLQKFTEALGGFGGFAML